MAAYVEMFSNWLPTMLEDQSLYRQFNLALMSDEEKQVYITQMSTALFCEVAEFVEELQWKYWKSKTNEFPIRNSKDHVTAEAVDVLHFLAHLLNVAGVTEDELNLAMQAKRTENDRRQNVGYSY